MCPEDVCPNCGQPLSKSQRFCPKCHDMNPNYDRNAPVTNAPVNNKPITPPVNNAPVDPAAATRRRGAAVHSDAPANNEAPAEEENNSLMNDPTYRAMADEAEQLKKKKVWIPFIPLSIVFLVSGLSSFVSGRVFVNYIREMIANTGGEMPAPEVFEGLRVVFVIAAIIDLALGTLFLILLIVAVTKNKNRSARREELLKQMQQYEASHTS